MSFWERSYIIIAIANLIASSVYFYNVVTSSIAANAVVAPSLSLVIVYVVLFVVIAVGGMIVSTVMSTVDDDDVPAGSEDERDRFVRLKSEAGASHVYAGIIWIALGSWFVHHNGYLLFHLVLAGIVVGDLFRCLMQHLNYNRAY